jgi:hypothetical protein
LEYFLGVNDCIPSLRVLEIVLSGMIDLLIKKIIKFVQGMIFLAHLAKGKVSFWHPS